MIKINHGKKVPGFVSPVNLTSLSVVSMIPSTSSADAPISSNGTMASIASGLSLNARRRKQTRGTVEQPKTPLRTSYFQCSELFQARWRSHTSSSRVCVQITLQRCDICLTLPHGNGPQTHIESACRGSAICVPQGPLVHAAGVSGEGGGPSMNKRLVSRSSARERGNTEEMMSAGDCPRDPVRPKTKEKKTVGGKGHGTQKTDWWRRRGMQNPGINTC